MLNLAELRSCLLSDLKCGTPFLTSDMSTASASALWLAQSFWKKFQDEVGPDADDACLKLFKESNERCAKFVLKPESTFDEQVIGEVQSLWLDLVGNGPESNLPLSDILDNGGVGPGANLGARSYNFYTKLFDGPLTGTSERLYRLYRYSIMANPTHLAAEKTREKRYGHLMVAGNRLSFVPKTSEISRSICTEPTLNMYLQKGLGFVLERWLKERFKIDLSRQPILNRRLARLGSVDGSYGTIDLSSASDSISLLMLRAILPAELLDWLELARSPTVTFPDGSVQELYMVSSMGNGFTFPLETLVFSTIVLACYRVLGIAPKYERSGPRNWAVFGDDIIVRKDAYEFVIRSLRLFGFTPNDHKSFNSGSFRESCGGDYFRGLDIRGVYCRSLKTSADVYSLINRLIRWSTKTGVLITQTVSYLKRQVEFLPIPFSDGDGEGIKTPYPPIGLPRDRNGSVKYRALTKVSKKIRMPISEDQRLFFRHRQSTREIGYNADGLMVAFVGGFIRNGSVGVQNTTDRFKVRNRVAASWPSWKPPYNLRDQIDRMLLRPADFALRNSSAEPLTAPEGDWEVTFDLYN